MYDTPQVQWLESSNAVSVVGRKLSGCTGVANALVWFPSRTVPSYVPVTLTER
jgi:hypothetical protein